jgi:hypothetical protein
MTISKEQLDQAFEIAKAATLGPWSYDDDEAEIHSDVMMEYGGDPYHIVKGDGSIPVNDAKFIAHFNPQFCLSLIEEIRRLTNELENADYGEVALIYKKKLDAAVKVIKFYADEKGEHWGACRSEDTSETCCHMVAEISGGKKAREYLKTLEKGDE